MLNNNELNLLAIKKEAEEQAAKLSKQVTAGTYLRQLRAQADLSLAKLGKELGVSAFYLSEVERGLKAMSDHFIRDISDFYNINESELFNILGRVPLLAREQLYEDNNLQKLLVEIKRNKKFTDEQRQEFFHRVYELYKNFPE